MAENGMLSAIEPTTPVGIAAPVILWSKARPLFELHAQALAGDDADAVHDIRLAARRTREALEIFEPLYEPEEYDWMSQIVRQITRALGPIRDADASIEEFAHLVEQLHAEDTRAALAYLIGYAAGDRAVRVQAMKGRLRLLNLAEKRQRFELGLHGFKRNADVATTLQAYAATVIPERLEAVLTHVPAALVRESTAEQQQMRTDIRHLRHAAETFRPVFGAEYNAIHRLLTEMQDVLATLADRDVFIGLVRAAESQPEASTARVSTIALEEVIRALDAERDAFFRQFRTILEEHRPQALRARLFSAAGIEGYAMPAVELEVAGAEAAVSEVTSRPQPTERIPVVGAPGAEATGPAEVGLEPERASAFTPAPAVPAASEAIEMPAAEAAVEAASAPEPSRATEAPSAVEAPSTAEPRTPAEPPSPVETPTPSWPPAATTRPEAQPPAAAAVHFGAESSGTAEAAPAEAVSGR
ncbi:MAG: CHAD domain-containing protein, partial [Coriobacteriales bacterium]|nr:CHAD domain-containing protein [Coriobacteriales bacterium]